MDPEIGFHIKVYTSSALPSQPWISDFTSMVNASYRVSHTTKIKFSTNKTRLHTDSALSEELGPDGFTAVAFVRDAEDQTIKVVGTASIKKWKDDGLWMPTTKGGHEESANTRCVDQMLHRQACPGDYELAVVALVPGSQYRGRGIAGRLVRVCEEEVLRRHRVNGKDLSSPIRIMTRVNKEDTGGYWLKQGFTVVGSQRRPKGFWDSLEEFTIWAMVRELSI